MPYEWQNTKNGRRLRRVAKAAAPAPAKAAVKVEATPDLPPQGVAHKVETVRDAVAAIKKPRAKKPTKTATKVSNQVKGNG